MYLEHLINTYNSPPPPHFTHLKPTFFILHFYFYKTLTSVCLLYTFIQIKYSFFFHFLLFSSLPLSPSQTKPPSSSLPDRRTTQDQTNLTSENHSRSNQPKIRSPFRPKPSQSESQIITHPTRDPLIKQQEISALTGGDLIRLRAVVV